MTVQADVRDWNLAEQYSAECGLYAKELRLVGCQLAMGLQSIEVGRVRFLWVASPVTNHGGRAILSLSVQDGTIHGRVLPFFASDDARMAAGSPQNVTFTDLDEALDWVSERIRGADEL
jgi:hypothetical protein